VDDAVKDTSTALEGAVAVEEQFLEVEEEGEEVS